jgi:hypothetical protein
LAEFGRIQALWRVSAEAPGDAEQRAGPPGFLDIMTILLPLLQLVVLGAPLLVGGFEIQERLARRRSAEGIRKAFPQGEGVSSRT